MAKQTRVDAYQSGNTLSRKAACKTMSILRNRMRDYALDSWEREEVVPSIAPAHEVPIVVSVPEVADAAEIEYLLWYWGLFEPENRSSDYYAHLQVYQDAVDQYGHSAESNAYRPWYWDAVEQEHRSDTKEVRWDLSHLERDEAIDDMERKLADAVFSLYIDFENKEYLKKKDWDSYDISLRSVCRFRHCPKSRRKGHRS